MINNFPKEFIEQSVYRITENSKRIKQCLDELEETEIWYSPNENSNSVGNLLLHLCGNIRQYIISGVGKSEDTRERDKEFSVKKGYTKAELLHKLFDTVNKAIDVIENCSENKLTEIYSVQGFNLSGIGIIIHVTEHYSYHTGQIAFFTKLIKNKDLGFYTDIDLNIKNKN